MKLIKKTAEYSVLERRDGRYAVKSKKGKMINGDDKVAILVNSRQKLSTTARFGTRHSSLSRCGVLEPLKNEKSA